MFLSSASSETSPHTYQAYFFGPFRLLHQAQPIEKTVWRRHKAKSLLKWLLLHPARPYSADQLIGRFWPESDPKAGLRNLYVTIHYLRRLMEPDLLPHQESRYLRRDQHNYYWLELKQSWWGDLHDLDQLYTHASRLDQAGQIRAASDVYRHIVSYCNKGFLPEDRYDDLFAPYHRQYDQLHVRVLERLIQLSLEMQVFDDVLLFAQQALQIDPLCEMAMCATAQAYVQTGNIVKAVQQLEMFQRFLQEEAMIEAGGDLLTLKQQLLQINSQRSLLSAG